VTGTPLVPKFCLGTHGPEALLRGYNNARKLEVFMRTLIRSLVVGVVVLGSSGLAPAQERQRGTITGRVLYQGKPLPGGIITIWSEKHAEKTALDRDGNFEFTALTPGEYRVTVSTEALKARGSPRYVAIPMKYGKPETSGLKIKVEKGNQTIDIKLQ